ncbi:MAG: BrnT family toxin [Hyphomicrobium sp.]|jgi:hypothetical protein
MRHGHFEWDDTKARANLLKHGVSFEEAAVALEDKYCLIEIDDGDPYEERWRSIGLAFSRVLFVVTTERQGNVTRIISARRATRHEENCYNRQTLSKK